MLSSLEALEKADAGASGTRSTVFQPKVKPRAKKSGGTNLLSAVNHGVNIVVGAKDTSFCTDVLQNASDYEAQLNKNAFTNKCSTTTSAQYAVAAKDGEIEAVVNEQSTSEDVEPALASLAHPSYEQDTKQSEALQVLVEDDDPSTGGSLPFASRSAIQLPAVEPTVGGVESIAIISQTSTASFIQGGQTSMQTTGKHKAEKARKKKAGFLTEAISTGVEEQSNTPINICGEQTNLQDEQTAGKHKAEKVHKKGGGSFTDTIAMGVEEQSSGPINICGEQNDLQDEQTTGKLKAEKARKKKGGYLTEAISTGVEEQSIGPRNICGDENKHTDIENEVKKVRKRKLPHRSVQHKRRVEKTVDITASDPTHLTMKQIICWAESKERKKLKENASQSKEHVIPASTSQQRVDHLGRAEKK
ncbi:hypothetical protein O6H91_Y506700 [Diphasiastrum complanatum]|nr:hypothetical protein O6H91_Y506700 [Diphasiastrum complanatum]